MAFTCLNTLVGLSATDVDCWTGTTPEGYNTSDSGYYLTDQDFGVNHLTGVAVAGWTILTNARAQAIREFKTDLLAAIRSRYDSALHPFSGYIGQLKHTGTRSVSNDFLGHRVRVRRLKGFRLVLQKVILGLNTSGSYDVTVTSNDELFDGSAYDLTVTHTANSWNGTDWQEEVSLPLWADTCPGDYLEYYIGFDRNGAQPLNNKLYCCGNNPLWKKHLDVSGFSADSATPELTGSFSTDGNGLVLKAYLTCENLDWLCELEQLNGYQTLDVAARCIQQRAAAIACGAALEMPEIGVGNGFNANVLADRRNFLNGRYGENVRWIAENLPKGVTDCFKCKPENKFQTQKLIV